MIAFPSLITALMIVAYLLIGGALAIAAVRLMWHAGSYLKRKRQRLDSAP